MDSCFASVAHLLPGSHNKVDWLEKAEDGEENENDRRTDSNVSRSISSIKRERILMEVVGAVGLESKKQPTVDPYCKIQQYNEKGDLWVVHRTDVISNDGNPIWTAKTNSFCIIQVPVTSPPPQDRPTALPNDTTAAAAVSTTESSKKDEEDVRNSLVIDVCHGRTTMGRVRIPYDEVLRCSPDERFEFPIVAMATRDSTIQIQQCSFLALRFRKATDSDVEFLKKLNQKSVRDLTKSSVIALDDVVLGAKEVASDINFQSVRTKHYFQRYSKIEKGKRYYRIMPYSDPRRPKETEWMTAGEIEHETYQPSTRWVTAGTGLIGKLHVEVLGCDRLPQMDIGQAGDKTDAFVVMALEDNIARTDVIWDKLSPRWLPWTTRAFVFCVQHPASLLYLSVVDYDETPMDSHDPIGRLCLRMNDFKPHMTYTLVYPLQHHPRQAPPSVEGARRAPRGTITLRLRIEWKDESEAMKLFLTPPPRFIINVDNARSYQVLRYTTRGAVNMDEASVETIQVYMNEILSYWKSFCFVSDVLLEILLWRGRWQLTDKISIWLPIRSMVLFGSAALLLQRPANAVSIVLFTAVWFLISINYHEHRHPYPWRRVQSCFQFNVIMIFGRQSFFSSAFSDDGSDTAEIAPNQGVEEGLKQSKLDDLKVARFAALLQAAIRYKTKVSNMRSKTKDSAVKITTESSRWSLTKSLVGDRLSPVHSVLSMICSYLRFGRNFLSWRSGYTAVFTTNCLIVAVVWLIFPMNTILLWMLRVTVWAFLGPWMKLVDIYYFRPWYATKQELLEQIENGKENEPIDFDLPDLDSLLESEKFYKLIKAGRMKTEELVKLRDMRTLLFGSYSAAVPYTVNTPYACIPLPESTAVRTDPSFSPLYSTGSTYIPGQKLTGSMIHTRPTAPREHVCGLRDTEQESQDGSQDDKKTK